MDSLFLSDVVPEIRALLLNKKLRRIWLTADCLAFDFGISRGYRDLLIATARPASPALFLYRPANKQDAEKPGPALRQELKTAFSVALKNTVTGSRLTEIDLSPGDRIVTLRFEDSSSLADSGANIVVAMTGRSSNIYLRDADGKLKGSLRAPGVLEGNYQIRRSFDAFDAEGSIQTVSDDATEDAILSEYFGPTSQLGPGLKAEFIARAKTRTPAKAFWSLIGDAFLSAHRALVYSRIDLSRAGAELINPGKDLLLSSFRLERCPGFIENEFPSFSEAATAHWLAQERARAFEREYQSTVARLTARVKSTKSALENINRDLEKFKEPERFKRIGDLLLANPQAQVNESGVIRLTDYFDPEQKEIDINAPDSKTPADAAARYYALYQKGRRTEHMLVPRRDSIAAQLSKLESELSRIKSDPTRETLRAAGVESAVSSAGSKEYRGKKLGGKAEKPRGREFISSDGLEIIVGRNDAENDQITFRVAGSLDLWLHAADYPGSHVVVRNPNRKTVPHRTIVEAAELAAFYSQAKREGKAAVNYTQKKFVTKPPKAKPGLVRLSSFKTVLVEPRCTVKRLEHS